MSATQLTGKQIKDATVDLTVDVTGALPAANLTPDVLPWLIDVDVFMTAISHVNWDDLFLSTLMIHGAQKASLGNINDEICFDVVLAKGTWTLEIMLAKGAECGIMTVYLDATSIGTIDGYDASRIWNARSSLTSISIAANGKKRLKLKITGKNALASNYYGEIQHIQFRRTA